MKLQSVQNNRQNVHFKQLSGNTNFLKHNFVKAFDGADMLGKDLLIKLNAEPALQGVKGHIEHSGTTNFIYLKKGWAMFKKKAEGAIADEKVTYESFKTTAVETSSKLNKKK